MTEVTLVTSTGKRVRYRLGPHYQGHGVLSDNRQTITFLNPDHIYYRSANLDEPNEPPAFVCLCPKSEHP